MNIRKISNSNNIKWLVAAIVTFFLSAGWLLYRYIHDNITYLPVKMLDGVCIVIGVISFFSIVILLSYVINNILMNRQLTNLPYFFDYQKELSTFIIIGNTKKKPKNGAVCFEKYSDWMKSILNCKYYLQYKESDDFFRYIVKIYRIQVLYTDFLVKLYLPIILAVLTFYWNVNNLPGIEKVVCMFITMMFLMFFMLKVLFEAQNELYFLRDYSEIIWPKRNLDVYK